MIGTTCSVVCVINAVIVVRLVMSMRERERKSKSLIGISVIYMLYCLSYIFTFISIMQWSTLTNMALFVTGRPMQYFGWAVVTCIFGWFATVFFKGLCNIILTVSYIQSYFKLRKMLTNVKEPEKK